MMATGGDMSGPPRHVEKHFRPLRPATGVRLVTAVILGPVVWVIAFVGTSIVVEMSDAIELGLLITVCSFATGFVILVVVRHARERERRRYERG